MVIIVCMSTLSSEELRSDLIKIFEPIKDRFLVYEKLYTILTTYAMLPRAWLESLYQTTKVFWTEQYHQYITHVHDDIHKKITAINVSEHTQQEDADNFLDTMLLLDEL